MVLVAHLRRCGIESERVLAAIARIPRERFIPTALSSQAYYDEPLPIGLGQTVSQPTIVAQMTEALELTGTETVLEIGTGSGYQTAVLACLCAKVISIERHEALSREAAARLEDLGVRNAFLHVADGTLGWPAEAPYDAILATGSLPDVPEALLSQLAINGGILVGPVGSRALQHLVAVRRSGVGYTRRTLGGCRFVPLIGKAGWDDEESGAS
ncbi:protein-L-isoaspartate(D-aspartate) O-methyltransferase [Candidatus Bipolaricaulota bacterium]|nr:protein-L-isoaspartate(D-aspartate) O-methyltransferase [Candidatus Bipolaricaulota bacterium]